jgi:hypothetical protein
MEKDVMAISERARDISWRVGVCDVPRRISVPTPIISAVYAIF